VGGCPTPGLQQVPSADVSLSQLPSCPSGEVFMGQSISSGSILITLQGGTN